MAQTLQEADDIESARLASGKVVFVGHMRRYATAFLRVKKIVHDLGPGDINYGESRMSGSTEIKSAFVTLHHG
jgi:predicted dehydrogenase